MKKEEVRQRVLKNGKPCKGHTGTLIPNWRNREMFNILGRVVAKGWRAILCQRCNYFEIER